MRRLQLLFTTTALLKQGLANGSRSGADHYRAQPTGDPYNSRPYDQGESAADQDSWGYAYPQPPYEGGGYPEDGAWNDPSNGPVPLSNEAMAPRANAEQSANERSEGKDVVAVMQSSAMGKLAVATTASVCGAALAGFISAITVNRPLVAIALGLALGALFSQVGGPVGELFRAMAVTLLLALRRLPSLRQHYPLLKQLKAFVVRRRVRFPPNAPQNLWRYTPAPPAPGQKASVRFSMARTVMAVFFLSGLIGNMIAKTIHIFFPFMITLAFSILGAYVTTLEASHGDFVRCLGMKFVEIIRILFDAAGETKMTPKTLALAGQLGTKLGKLDQKYQIRSRVGSATSFLWGKATASAERIQKDMKSEGGDEAFSPPPPVHDTYDGYDVYNTPPQSYQASPRY